MKLVFKHEAPIAGNASVTETYELTQEELLPMIRRDRALRAAAEHRDEEELEFRAPQCILQELWNAEERVAHSWHRSDRVVFVSAFSILGKSFRRVPKRYPKKQTI